MITIEVAVTSPTCPLVEPQAYSLTRELPVAGDGRAATAARALVTALQSHDSMGERWRDVDTLRARHGLFSPGERPSGMLDADALVYFTI